MTTRASTEVQGYACIVFVMNRFVVQIEQLLGCVCVSVRFVWTISFERNDVTFYLDTFDLLVLLDLSSVRISDDQGQRENFLPENILAMCK